MLISRYKTIRKYKLVLSPFQIYEVLDILHVLKNVISRVWEIDIMSCFTKLSLIKGIRKIN